MAEILTYSQSLTSLTGGRGDYHMHFLRYEEVPTHIAQKIIDETKKEKEEVESLECLAARRVRTPWRCASARSASGRS